MRPQATLLLAASISLLASVSAPARADSLSQATFDGMGFLYQECPNQRNYSRARAITPDGRTAVGHVYAPNESGCLGEWASIAWTAEGGLRELDPLRPLSATDYASDVNADASAVVGHRIESSGLTDPYRWTDAEGLTILGQLPGATSRSGIGRGVSADGSVVVGRASSPEGPQAFRWTPDDGMVGLGFLNPDVEYPPGNPIPWSDATDVSADGSVVVGNSLVDYVDLGGMGAEIYHAFLWTPQQGLVDLGSVGGSELPPYGFIPYPSGATAVSPDGQVVVGWNDGEPFRWTAEEGMVLLGDIPGGTDTGEATDVSGDGSLVVGLGWWAPNSLVSDRTGLFWDEVHGSRTIAEVLESRYGFDLRQWEINELTGISPDGRYVTGWANDDSAPVSYSTQGFVAFLPDPYSIVLDGFERGAVALETTAGGPDTASQVQTGLSTSHVLGGQRSISLQGAPASASSSPGFGPDALLVTLPPAGGSLQLAYQSPAPVDLTHGGRQDRFAIELGSLDGSLLATFVVRDGSANTSGGMAAISGSGRRDILYASLSGEADLAAITDVEIVLGAFGPAEFAVDVLRTGRAPACSNGQDDDGDGLVDHPADPGCAAPGSEREDARCSNGIDDDGDGAADFPDDPECDAPSDATEGVWACNDGIDNDGNGLADYPADSGCTSPTDPDEATYSWVCADDIDNDGDGLVDWPEDTGCAGVTGSSENHPYAPDCDNGIDDDGDGRTDFLEDPGCDGAADFFETSSLLPCDDGVDNDGDGLIDWPDDPGCAQLVMASEDPACDDDVDNDGDGGIDWDGGPGGGAPDPQCVGAPSREREGRGTGCGLGLELVLPLLSLMWLRARRGFVRRSPA